MLSLLGGSSKLSVTGNGQGQMVIPQLYPLCRSSVGTLDHTDKRE